MNNITIYTTPACVYCKMAKAFFNANKIQYQERNVAEDAKARDEAISRSGQMGVPVIDINGEIVVGFDKSRISELLSIK